ncbi:MAG TPA: Ig-like domain-containing protein, partial [Flavisolibacter sp.]
GGDGTGFSYARSNGDGTFTIVAQASSPFAGLSLPNVASELYRVADFDGDGDQDVWIPVNSATGTYFRNDGSSFSSQSSASFPNAQFNARNVVGDFDADGDADILYQTGGDGTSFSYARSNGNGTFTIVAQASSPFAGLALPNVATGLYRVADYDGDLDHDIWIPANSATGTYLQQAGTPPVVTSTSPANNANGVLVTANIVLNFSEIVNKNVGTIYIRKVSDNSLHMAIDVTSAMVTGGGTSTITINPSWDLQQLTQYYVTVDAETFADAGGAVYAGINNSTTLRFTTTTPLPAQWTGVNASVVNNKIKVDWSTTNESNASRYEVERSVNGISFTSIGSVAAANTPGDHQYSFEDAGVTKGSTYFYRIKLVDIDGKQSRSAVVSAALSGGIKQGLMIHSNPRGGALQATIFAVRTQKAAIRLISTSGQVVAQQDVPLQAGENRIKLPGADLPAGTYILQVTTTEGVMQQKVLKQ